MLARPDSSAPSGLSAASAAAFPPWARALHAPETAAEAGFLAGAALARLDAIVRENPPWAGAWRRRLALAAAAASVRRAGRNEDEAALRDALHLTRPGGDPGPAGRRLLAWRALAVGTSDNGAPRSRAPPTPWTSPATTRCYVTIGDAALKPISFVALPPVPPSLPRSEILSAERRLHLRDVMYGKARSTLFKLAVGAD